MEKEIVKNDNLGHDALWLWFGLSRASFLVLPRVLMHEMPDDWQRKMALLLDDYDKAYPNLPNVQCYVNLKQNNKFIKIPEWMINYRYPDKEQINKLRVEKYEPRED